MQMAMPLSRTAFEEESLRLLIEAAKAGDEAAFERIVWRYQHPVLRLAQRILLNREASRDVAQDVFLRLYRSLGAVDASRDLQAWLYRATSNACYDVLRRGKRDLPLDVLEDPMDDALNPEQSMNAAQQRRLVLAGMQRLSAREREVIALRDLEGYTTEEVAAILKLSQGTVRSHLSTGRIKLKNFVAAAGSKPL